MERGVTKNSAGAGSLVVSGKGAEFRDASEDLHREQGADDRYHANYRMLWKCGFADLIRRDFYDLFEFSLSVSGYLLEAGCGTGVEVANFQRQAPGLTLHGVDISSVVLAEAVRRPDKGAAMFYQATLEQLPFADSMFDFISSHEVVEHVEDPSVVLREFGRVLKPGGICVIATPNGASLWADQLRQRVYRLFGRRGAPVGQDHTRPPKFWRREFTRAGLVVERQIFDGAALEFQTYFARASWMPRISRALEPLRAVPIINVLVCDRVKFRLRKPGAVANSPHPVVSCCPLCFASLVSAHERVVCARGHRFKRQASGVVDFTAVAQESVIAAGDSSSHAVVWNAPTAKALAAPLNSPPGMNWKKRLRRSVLFTFGCCYAAMLVVLVPLGIMVAQFHQPFDKADH